MSLATPAPSRAWAIPRRASFSRQRRPGPADHLGLGPVGYYPTNTDRLLGPDKWGLGPTFVALVQTGPWTIGVLANQIWSVGGGHNEQNISSTFLQPFIVYTTKTPYQFRVEHGVDLRLGKQPVDGADQFGGPAGLQNWQTTHGPSDRRTLLRRSSLRWRGLGPPRELHAPFPNRQAPRAHPEGQHGEVTISFTDQYSLGPPSSSGPSLFMTTSPVPSR